MINPNERMISKAIEKLRTCPFLIKDIFLLLNTKDFANNVKAGSALLWVQNIETLGNLSIDEKCILLAHVIEKLGISMTEIYSFLRSKS